MVRAHSLALAACTAAVCFASAAFVALPASGPRKSRTPQQAAEGMVASAATSATPVPLAVESAHGPSVFKWLGAGLLAGVILAVSAPEPANAENQPFSIERFTVKNARHLELCKNNKKYAKKMKDQIYKVQQRQKKYPKDSVVYNRFVKKINGIKKRQEAYGERYCGKQDGLPRTIATGEWVRGGIVIPSLAFLYTTGWIGWAGRSYLIRTNDEMKELNIDVPLALTCMASGFAWPVAAWQEIVNGEMVVKDEDLYRGTF